jgi:PPOX class probable F420-dependent enzyme
MPKMPEGAWRDFLTSQPRTGKLATTRADGSPHVTPIWFALDGDEIVFTTHHTSVKARNIARDPRVSLCVDDERPPFSFVIIQGTASNPPEDQADLPAWATKLGGRYMGADRAEEYGKRNGVPGELVMRVRPTRILAQAAIAD